MHLLFKCFLLFVVKTGPHRSRCFVLFFDFPVPCMVVTTYLDLVIALVGFSIRWRYFSI